MSKPQVLILTHAPWERPGRIVDALEACDLDYVTTSIISKPTADLPDFNELAGLVLMGGPMGALDFDKYPGLEVEAKLAKAAMVAGKPVLGVCLGHQIMATALGGKLKPGKAPEIGFGTVTRLENSHEFLPMWGKKATVLHWHNDCVTLPAGATPLAKSDLTKVQAFRFGTGLGMQFHLEVTPTLFEEWLSEKEMVKDLKKSQVSQMRDEFPEKDALIKPFATAVFEGFAARCSTHARTLDRKKPKKKKIVIS
ncbi:MAG: type 1 glutamine amidotransferase [Bifidobacteriaceae bacterium]|nr:type 1 glutamine amidotransferase [Bifidobacteriaceae bacterium]